MTDVLTQVLADLEAEGDRLEQLVAGLDEDGWRTPTPAPGWDVATQVAHLAWTDEVAVKAATDKEAWDEVVLGAIGDPTGYVDAQAFASVCDPTVSTTPAQRSFCNGLPGADKVARSITSDAPSDFRYSASAAFPVDATTR